MMRDHHLPYSVWACGADSAGGRRDEWEEVAMGQRATHSAPRRRLGAANDPIGDSSHHCAPARVRCEPRDRANSGVGCGPGGFGSAAGEHAGRPGGAAGRQAGAMCRRGSSGVTQPCASQWARLDADAGDAKQRRRTLKFTPLLALWGLAVSGMFGRGDAMQANNGGALVLADSGRGGPMSSPAYANTFETWNTFSKRTSTSPVTFRLQAETKFGWEVCVTGGCEALGYWDPDKALLLRTDPSRYPIWEGIGQLPGGCDIEYKYLMRPRGRAEGTMWEDCANRIIRTSTIEKAILLVTDPEKMTQEELARQEMVTSQYFNEWTTLAAPFSSTLIFNTARPQEDFKELLEDEAFQRPCALVFCRDSGTEIFVRDYDTPLISAPAEAEPLLDTRPENSEEGEQLVSSLPPKGSDVNSLD